MLTGSLDAVEIAECPRIEVGPGCFRRDLPSRSGVRIWMVEMDPGARWPRIDRHDAAGEDILVVAGELIEDERVFKAGSFVAFGPESTHQPRTELGVTLFGFNLLQA